ncbi:MAG: hypothetical protein JWM10_2466, partial [Myxococcaceae bacterium]|nr:hypothetical protein [Myxococcaceae bacterium]
MRPLPSAATGALCLALGLSAATARAQTGAAADPPAEPAAAA